MRTRTILLFVVFATFLSACADIWGFQDLTASDVSDGSAPSYDATISEGSAPHDAGGNTTGKDGGAVDSALPLPEACANQCDGGCTVLATDPANCGKCGVVCASGNCVNGSIQ